VLVREQVLPLEPVQEQPVRPRHYWRAVWNSCIRRAQVPLKE
jgi:hypothetical protein